MKNNYTLFLIKSGIIAAIYVILTYFSAALNLAYGPVQLRLSEVLTILPVFGFSAVPGITIGCFIANIGSFNPLDMLFGTLASLLAAILTYFLRKYKFLSIPFLSFLPPIIINALVVGAEICVFYLSKFTFSAFITAGMWVAFGQSAVIFILGIPFYKALKKYNNFL